MPLYFITFFSFIFFLMDVLAKDRVRSGMIELKYVEYDVVMLIVVAFNLSHPAFDLLVRKYHAAVNIFHLHLYQVDFYVADSGTGRGL